jgi:hypothetical protein
MRKGTEGWFEARHAADDAREKAETPQANPLLCLLEETAIAADARGLYSKGVMLRNLAVVLREDEELCNELQRRMAHVLRELASKS